MEQNPHVKVDFQWFAFGDLGKKLSVGFATGTAPDGFVSQDWFMPVWLDKGLLAPLDVKKLGYDFLRRLYRRFRQGVRRRRHQGRQGLRLSDVVLRLLQLSQRQAVQGSRARRRKGLAAELGAARRSRQAADHQGRRQVRAPGLQVRDACGAVDHDPVQSDPAAVPAANGSTSPASAPSTTKPASRR